MLDEVVQHDGHPELVVEAAVAAMTMLGVVNVDLIQYRSGWKSVGEVRSRVMGVDQDTEIFMLKPVQQKVIEWASVPD